MTSRSHLNPSHRFDSVRSPFARRVRAARRQPNNDGGFTLPELLVAMTLSGVLIAAISLAISVMLTATPEAEIRLAESKDITFLQTWVPVDLSSAINSYDNPDEADLENEMAAGEPSMSYNVPLAGTNVLTLVVPDLEADDYKIVSYRYVLSAGDWRLVRYLIKNPGTASESLSQVGVASEVKDPPIGSTWKPGEKPVHAFQITSRNQVVLGCRTFCEERSMERVFPVRGILPLEARLGPTVLRPTDGPIPSSDARPLRSQVVAVFLFEVIRLRRQPWILRVDVRQRTNVDLRVLDVT